MMSGYGRLIYAQGDFYEGFFKEGMADGNGVYQHYMSSRYEGHFKTDY